MWYVFNVITSVGRQIDVYWPIKIHKSYRPTVFLNVIAALHVKNRIILKLPIKFAVVILLLPATSSLFPINDG